MARRFLLAVGNDDGGGVPLYVIVPQVIVAAVSVGTAVLSMAEERRDNGRTRPGRLKVVAPPPLPFTIGPLPAVVLE